MCSEYAGWPPLTPAISCVCVCHSALTPPPHSCQVRWFPTCVGLKKRLTVIFVMTKILEHIWPEQSYHVVGNTEHWPLCPIFLSSSAVQGSQAFKRMRWNYFITSVELLTAQSPFERQNTRWECEVPSLAITALLLPLTPNTLNPLYTIVQNL